MRSRIAFLTLLAIVLGYATTGHAMSSEERLGRFLYFDADLSSPPGQSCASCHHPSAGFADPDQSLPVSEGVIPGRFGTRNSPSAAYASFSPPLFFDGALWIGGQFWDGRAPTLVEQAKGPFLNPVEMNNTKEGVVQAVRNAPYASLFRFVYGRQSLNDVETAYALVAKAIAAFETTKPFSRFSSKYDFFLKGRAKLSAREQRGLALFNDPAKGNCAACHPSVSADGITPPLFTDFSYDDLGIPKNFEIEELIGEPVPVDLGLGNTVGPSEDGKFKVMTLRGIAQTAPYGHNGYFKTLKDIVHFYNTRDLYPVCGPGGTPGADCWPAPEVGVNVNTTEMGNLGLTPAEEDDIVAFLLTLTDGYYCRN